jgi:glycosidase
VIRYFGNVNLTNRRFGDIGTNGCGKFDDLSSDALGKLRAFGITHLWLTGVLRQATLTDYSRLGLAADVPDIVKGLAGSFYAVRDYYDVCPDYANNPANRMQEFENLIDRIHAAGMQVLIDLVPNHVSRGYSSVVAPQPDLGHNDNPSRFCDSGNHFYYMPTGKPLRLSRPPWWNPPGFTFTGTFPLENGGAAHPVKVTANDLYSYSPDANSWYDGIKLNYGFNFQTNQGSYEPRPRTWDSIDAILAYWQAKGVDGFRCDFAHYVPAEAWSYLIAKARNRRAAYFFAEAYPFPGTNDPVHSLDHLIQAGFDNVYHYQAYNALKRIYLSGLIDEYDREMLSITDAMRPHLVSYLENHDERRVASPFIPNAVTGDTGFGSLNAGYQLAPLHLLSGNGPALLLNGQEVGEPGAGDEGFSPAEDGRTTIYDYWAMPEFVKWVNGHRYDGGNLSPEQLALRRFYGDLFALCQNASVSGSGYWGLWYFNRPQNFFDCPSGLYSFARFQPGSGAALLVATNFQYGNGLSGRLRIPRELSAIINLQNNITVELVLNRTGSRRDPLGTFTVETLAQSGFPVTVGNQESQVFVLHV